MEQIRIAAYDSSPTTWLLELVAGMIEPGETLEQVAKREAVEDTGLSVGRCKRMLNTPDFHEMMRLCETNFAQLRRLLPPMNQVGEAVAYQVHCASYRLTIQESTRYTTLVEITQTAPVANYWSLPSMTVRLCHDAMVAEMCFSQQISYFKAHYDYSNKSYINVMRNIKSTSSSRTGYAIVWRIGAMAVPVC